MDSLRGGNSQIRTVSSLEIDVRPERVNRFPRKHQESPTNFSMISQLNLLFSLKDFAMNADLFSRRNFLQCSAVAVAAGSVVNGAASALAHPISASLAVAEDGLRGRLWKTLKIGMVNVPGSLTDKFRAAKAAGFEGIEMNAPGMDVEETRKAIAESGLPVDGTVNSTHWDVRHTDPNPEVRAKALESLKNAIVDRRRSGNDQSTVSLRQFQWLHNGAFRS